MNGICDVCNKKKSLMKLSDDDLKLSLNICQECFDENYSEHDFEWL